MKKQTVRLLRKDLRPEDDYAATFIIGRKYRKLFLADVDSNSKRDQRSITQEGCAIFLETRPGRVRS